MKPYPARTPSAAALLAALLLASLAAGGRAQTVAPAQEEKDAVVQLEKLTVTTGYRSPKAIDQIPGAIKLVSNEEISNTQLLTDDATAVLSRTVPGYAPGT